MLIGFEEMLRRARAHRFAVGAFNVYNMEGALAVVRAAEALDSPVIVQILPSALAIGGTALIRFCREAGIAARIPVAVHLDHCPSAREIVKALSAGVSSVMADGSMLDFEGNLAFTGDIVQAAARCNAGVEGELGRLSGSEDGLDVAAAEARMTRPAEAADFASRSGVSALAVCIGNIHGTYTTTPRLDFERLAAIAARVDVPLVLHGTSGLPDEMVLSAISHGVSKFNVNTEIRTAYLDNLERLFGTGEKRELVDVMQANIGAMQGPIKAKIRLFGSADKAHLYP